MIEKHFDRWEDFDDYVREMEREAAESSQTSRLRGSRLLFRGHAKASWQLETTLERRIKGPVKALKYFDLVLEVAPEIQTFTGRRFPVAINQDFLDWATSYEHKGRRRPPAYEYLVYLRHHGFPSPLLDWSRSRYVATYFAFAHARDGYVALYAYRESETGFKTNSSDLPQIITLDPRSASHSRHFLQQSQYTMCCSFVEDPGPGFTHQWRFVPHDSVVGLSDLLGNQDLLWQFTLPASERTKVLKILDAYNLNAFSLFQSEEALLETIALREIELNGQPP